MLRRTALVTILLGLVATPAPGAPPQVDKLEPPSWWTGSAWTPIRLLAHGRGLGQAQLSAQAPLSAGNLKFSERGTYLFADLTIPPEAAPGKYRLRFAFAGGGAQEVEFELLSMPDRSEQAQGFSPADFIYLIMPDRFANGDPSNDDPAVSRGLWDRGNPRYYHGGDLQGVIDHATYLRNLGVTAAWLNPWYDNNNRLNEKERYGGQPMADYHGYGAVDYYAVEEHFGTLPLLQKMVTSLQAEGIKAIQDQVANHVGPYHPWTADPPTPAWFNGTPARHTANTWQTWTLMDPYGSREMRRATLEGWFIDILPDLNQNELEVRRYLIQNSLWWVGVTGIDAIRQDTMPYVPRDFWRDWTAALKKDFPLLKVVGEVFDGDPALVSFYQGGRQAHDHIDTGVHSVFDFPLFFALRAAFARNGDLRDVPRVLAHDFLYPNPGMLVTFAGLHDVARFMSEPGATPEGLKMAFTALFTLRGVPMVYYGDEIGMRGGNDPDNRRDFPGGWKDDPRNAFTEAGRTAEENGILHHLQSVARLRRQFAALREGVMTNLHASEKQWVYVRKGSRVTAIVAFNTANAPAQVEIDEQGLEFRDGDTLTDRLSGATATVEKGRLRLELAARRSAVWIQ